MFQILAFKSKSVLNIKMLFFIIDSEKYAIIIEIKNFRKDLLWRKVSNKLKKNL